MTWRAIETAPKDGDLIRLRVGGRTYKAAWHHGLVDQDDRECGGWFADDENDHPPGWTDGICWDRNEDGRASKQPTGWQPLPEPQ